ncbi:MAG: hypothetical protein HC820_05000 [Hydrococcus sp. RM1_1_31]|nr:hypothetical protein [Hydrococcus sp. RM1_1_31]
MSKVDLIPCDRINQTNAIKGSPVLARRDLFLTKKWVRLLLILTPLTKTIKLN